MADALSPAVSDRICKHMNDDHASAVARYAQAYGGLTEAIGARMLAIDPQGMDLLAVVGAEQVPLRIAFDHELQDSEDAHQTLIAMLRTLR